MPHARTTNFAARSPIFAILGTANRSNFPAKTNLIPNPVLNFVNLRQINRPNANHRELLGLDSRELGSFVTATNSGSTCGIVIFDSVPGGAGHVTELLALSNKWVEMVEEVLFVDESHHSNCVSACLNCLLSFETQFDHDVGLLARARTWDFWQHLRKGSPGAPPISPMNTSTQIPAIEARPAEQSRSDADRIARAKTKRQKKR